MIDFEREFLATERMRERMHEAEHERMARAARRAAQRAVSSTTRGGWALALMRRLVRATAA